MRTVIARVGEFVATVGRQAVPLDGLFARDWQVVTALAIYWLESLLLALSAVALCELMNRRTSELAAHRARVAGAYDHAKAIDAEREQFRQAHIKPNDVATFHLGSLGVFGFFLAMVVYMMIANRLIEQRLVWSELRDGALGMLVAVGLGFTIDVWRFPSMSVNDVQARVNSCFARWGLFWLLGFVGTAGMIYTGRASFFVGLFAGLKLTWEVWGTLARMLGWRSLKDREADARATS